MTTKTVTSQVDLDTALADSDVDLIIINSPQDVWLTLSQSGSATVRASDSARVEAYDSATVEGYDSATVRAYDSATVRAGAFVAVHLFSAHASISGGVVIDVSELDLYDATWWAKYRGVDVTDGRALVYKAVDAELNAGHRHTLTAYPIGGTITAPDWQASTSCGAGLHFGRNPREAHDYYTGSTAARFLEVEIDLSESVGLDEKVKSRSCRVIREVDIDGQPLADGKAVA